MDQPVDHLIHAFSALDKLPSTRLIDRSALYQSAPVGPPNQPAYINAVVALRTALKPLALLKHLHSIERQHKRVRSQKWGRRTLDLDILMYGKTPFNHPRLVIPHPMLHRREFVLVPLNEINPDLAIPGKGTVNRLVGRLKRSKISAVSRLS